MSEQNPLSIAGLTNWETQVYKALITLGKTTTGPLVKQSKVPQSKIYVVLEMLQEKGIVNYLKINGVKHFQAASTERIMTLFKERESELQKALQSIPQLAHSPTSVELFEGLKAIRIAHATLLENTTKKKQMFGYSRGDTYPEDANTFYHWWGERKRHEKIKDHLLVYEKVKKVFEKSIAKDQLSHVKTKTRYSQFALPTDTLIYGDTVLFYHWKEIPQVIVITDQEIATNYKEFYTQLWDIAQQHP